MINETRYDILVLLFFQFRGFQKNGLFSLDVTQVPQEKIKLSEAVQPQPESSSSTASPALPNAQTIISPDVPPLTPKSALRDALVRAMQPSPLC